MRSIVAVLCLLIGASAFAEEVQEPFDWATAQPSWVAPFEPFRVIGNIYYVGTEGLAVYLITSDEGHALIDGGIAGYEQIIIDNILTLGFDIRDVKILLNTHAHFDHSGGLAALKEASGAKLVAHQGDVSALEGGFYLGSEVNRMFFAPPVDVDRMLSREMLEAGWHFALGSLDDRTHLQAEPTPGHSRGCTSWKATVEESSEQFDVLIFCSATVAANRLVPEQYPGIVADYRYTFSRTKDWDPDVFLANHPEVFLMKETRKKQKAGDSLAFVNRGAFQAYIAEKERAFERALAEQTAKAEDE